MSTTINSIKAMILEVRTYLKIRLKYPKIYRNSKIESYVSPNIKIGEHVKIKPNCLITDSLTSIGEGTYIGDNTSILNCHKIGNYCSISHGVKLGLNNHALDHISTNPLFYNKANGWVKNSTYSNDKGVTIEHDVLISANVMIMAGVTIGTGSVIGAGAFINKDIPPYSIVVGSPGKIIRKRFDEETIQKLLLSKWWELDKSELLKHQQYFNQINNFLDAKK